MKRNLSNLRSILLVLITGLILTSCSKDKTSTDNLVGTWTAGASTYTAKVGDMSLTQYFTDVLGLPADQAATFAAAFTQGIQQAFSGTLQIKSDGTYSSNFGGTVETGTWSLSSDGTKLTVVPTGDTPETLDVLLLTSNKMKLKLSETLNEDLNGDDTPELINVDLEVNFTR
jgi:hypothetical protein